MSASGKVPECFATCAQLPALRTNACYAPTTQNLAFLQVEYLEEVLAIVGRLQKIENWREFHGHTALSWPGAGADVPAAPIVSEGAESHVSLSAPAVSTKSDITLTVPEESTCVRGVDVQLLGMRVIPAVPTAFNFSPACPFLIMGTPHLSDESELTLTIPEARCRCLKCREEMRCRYIGSFPISPYSLSRAEVCSRFFLLAQLRSCRCACMHARLECLPRHDGVFNHKHCASPALPHQQQMH